MATKYICDRCGSEKNVGRVTMSMAVSSPHGAADLPKMDQDLCPKCLNYFLPSIKQAFLPLSRS